MVVGEQAAAAEQQNALVDQDQSRSRGFGSGRPELAAYDVLDVALDQAESEPDAVAGDRVGTAELGGGVDDQAAVSVVQRRLEQGEEQLLQVAQRGLSAGEGVQPGRDERRDVVVESPAEEPGFVAEGVVETAGAQPGGRFELGY